MISFIWIHHLITTLLNEIDILNYLPTSHKSFRAFILRILEFVRWCIHWKLKLTHFDRKWAKSWEDCCPSSSGRVLPTRSSVRSCWLRFTTDGIYFFHRNSPWGKIHTWLQKYSRCIMTHFNCHSVFSRVFWIKLQQNKFNINKGLTWNYVFAYLSLLELAKLKSNTNPIHYFLLNDGFGNFVLFEY